MCMVQVAVLDNQSCGCDRQMLEEKRKEDDELAYLYLEPTELENT